MSLGPKPYPVFYDPNIGLQYVFESGPIGLAGTSITSAVLTGYVSGAGTVAATDTILQAFNKLNGNASLYLPLAGGTLSGTTTFSKAPVLPATSVAASGGTITPDARLTTLVIVTVDAAATVHGPTNGYDGQKVLFRFVQDNSGHAVTLSSGAGNFEFGTDITSFGASGANLVDYVGVVYNSARGKWDVVSVCQGF